MGFEEDYFKISESKAIELKEDFERKYGKEDEMSEADRRYYEINYKDTAKRAVMIFNDRINCGGYALEIDKSIFPNGLKFANYISGILSAFKFVRLLGDEPLKDDEYLVFYRFYDYDKNNGHNRGHHFVKVEEDGLVVEKNSCGRPMIFDGWVKKYENSPEAVFAVKKNHEHLFDMSFSDSMELTNLLKGGLDFEQTVSKAIIDKNNEFSYHSHEYRLKKSQNDKVVVTDDKGEIIADVLTDGEETVVQVIEGKQDYVENLSGPVKPIIKNGKLINYKDFKKGKDEKDVDR